MYVYTARMNTQNLKEQPHTTKSENVNGEMPVWTKMSSNVYRIQRENLRAVGRVENFTAGTQTCYLPTTITLFLRTTLYLFLNKPTQ